MHFISSLLDSMGKLLSNLICCISMISLNQ